MGDRCPGWRMPSGDREGARQAVGRKGDVRLGKEGRCHLTDVPRRILSLFLQKTSFKCNLGMTFSSLSFHQGKMVFCCSGRSHLGPHGASRIDRNLGHYFSNPEGDRRLQ